MNTSINLQDLHIVTISTDQKFYYPFLVESCLRNGKELTTLGMGEKWEGYNWKFKKMIEFLDKIPDNDIVCFVDGYDVICLRDLNEMKTEFIRLKKLHQCKIIVGTDRSNYFLKSLQTFFFGKCKNENLNSGTYIGYAKDLKNIIREIYYLNPINNADDQVLMTQYCNQHPNDIYLDSDNTLFLTLIYPMQEIDNKINIVNKRIYYNNRQPFFLHANGCGYLNNILINLDYSPKEHIKNDLNKYLIKKIGTYVIDFITKYYLFLIFLIILIMSWVYKSQMFSSLKKMKSDKLGNGKKRR